MNAAELAERSLVESECNILTLLRRETSAIHQELDQGLDIIGRLHEADTRVEMVNAYYRFHLGTEKATAPFLESIAEMCFSARRRSALLAEDLRQLGCCLPAQDGKLVAVNSRAEALGAFYVVEGSSLGGKMISRQLKRLSGG